MLRAYTEDIGLLEVTAVDKAEAQRVADGLTRSRPTPTAAQPQPHGRQEAARQARGRPAPPETDPRPGPRSIDRARASNLKKPQALFSIAAINRVGSKEQMWHAHSDVVD